MSELRQAFRQLAKHPGFTIVAVLTLALGIGATTAVFTVVDAVLLRPLPVRDQDRLLVAWQVDRARGDAQFLFPFYYQDYEAARVRTRTLTDVAALPRHGPSQWVAQDGERDLVIGGVPVTGEFFRVLSAQAAAGRLLEPRDDVRGAGMAVVLSYGAWQREFGGTPDLVGQTIEVVGRNATVVGVAPRGFDYPRGTDLWVPALAWWNPDVAGGLDPRSRFVELVLVARLAPGAAPEQARAELEVIAAGVRLERPAPIAGQMAVVTAPLQDVLVGEVRPVLLLLAAAAGLLLLIAGGNVAGLLLVRGLDRRRELAVRTALGAGRGRITRQLLTETLLLGIAGGVLGVLLAGWGVGALLALAPPELPRIGEISVDGRALGFATLVSLLSAMAFGLLPALGVSALSPAASLSGGDRAVGAGGSARRTRHALVIGQIALTLVVLSGAGLLLKSLARLNALEPGFRAERLVLLEMAAAGGWTYETNEHRQLFWRLLDRVRALPGVVAATAVTTRPFSGSGGIDIVFTAEGQDAVAADANPWLNYEGAEPDYFRTLGLTLLGGRTFTAADRGDSPPVVIVNETMARQTWPNADAVGKRIRWGRPDSDQPWITVVGVVGDTRYRTFQEVRPTVYVPWEQGIPVNPYHLLVRSRTTAPVVPAVRRVLKEIDPSLVLQAATPMEEVLAQPLARPRFQTLLLGLLAGMGLLLSAVGLYGVVSYAVSARTRELGLRVALGAKHGDVVGLMLRGAAALAGGGIAFGLAGAAVGTRLLRRLLFQVEPLDPATFAGVTIVLVVVALLAAFVPARRAARVDPLEALRHE